MTRSLFDPSGNQISVDQSIDTLLNGLLVDKAEFNFDDGDDDHSDYDNDGNYKKHL
jgi:hypothetical protein